MDRPIVTLLSDFGTRDGFVGAVKGVILSLAPSALLVDITHDIPPQDLRAGAWALREAAPQFPEGTIHVAVVDPGVGTARHPLILRCGGQTFVGPDNGLLTFAAPASTQCQAWALTRPEFFRARVSRTFHGRDIFAPAAGHLAAGLSPGDLGEPVSRWETLRLPAAVPGHGEVRGEVIHVDHFGNLISNITDETLDDPAGWSVRWRDREVGPLRGTFGDVPRGQWVAYLGSSGHVEIAVRDGRAAARDPGQDLYSEVLLWR